jgi:hypothetical protein
MHKDATGAKMKSYKNLLLRNGNMQSIDIWHVTSPCGSLQNLYKSCPCSQNLFLPKGSFSLYRLV